ncbi:MAG: hypothetical protein K5Q00_06015, partial [Gammaproteobacteria bacterium]|nr:hypothetical protein [Gammaproteobacteria bacterium]
STSNNIMYLSFKTPQTRWGTRVMRNAVVHYFFKYMDAFNDTNPALNFIAAGFSSNVPLFYQIDTTGKIIAYPHALLQSTSRGFDIDNVIAADSHVILDYENPGSMISYKDLSTQNDWQQIVSNPFYYPLKADNYNNGLLCNVGLDDSKNSNNIFVCLDTNQQEKDWQVWPLTVPEMEANNFQILPRDDDGAWLNFYAYNVVQPGDNAIAAIYTYDRKTNTASNTNFPVTHFPKTQASTITEVNSDSLVACIGDGTASSTQPIQLFYYAPSEGWSAINLSNTSITRCNYSLSGSPSHGGLHRVNANAGETLWLFNSPGPSKDQDHTTVYHDPKNSA